MKIKMLINHEMIEMNYKRIFVISDIHNDYVSYCQMRDRLQWGEDDLVLILGDIVDRGGEGADPLSLMSEIRFEDNRNYKVIMLKGNHEKMLAAAIRRYCYEDKKDYHYNSLDILADQLNKEELLAYADWMDHLPLGFEMKVEGYRKKFKMAHASTGDLDSEGESVWGSAYLFQVVNGDREYINVIGHTVTNLARNYFETSSSEDENTDILKIEKSVWFIDCGNGYRMEEDYPGKLGCLELSGRGKITEHYV